jgi:type II secretory pathway component GspD/PulD (secretin)
VPDSSILAFALLNASGSDNTYNILSTPQLLTVDNERPN